MKLSHEYLIHIRLNGYDHFNFDEHMNASSEVKPVFKAFCGYFSITDREFWEWSLVIHPIIGNETISDLYVLSFASEELPVSQLSVTHMLLNVRIHSQWHFIAHIIVYSEHNSEVVNHPQPSHSFNSYICINDLADQLILKGCHTVHIRVRVGI